MRLLPGKRPRNLGIHDGELAPCPDKPNCVNSRATDGRHAIEPLPLLGDPASSMERLREILSAMPRTEVVVARPDYLYAECASRLLGFVDDLEFQLDGQTIQVRSASRLGHSDLGVNRKRIEKIRSIYQTGRRNSKVSEDFNDAPH